MEETIDFFCLLENGKQTSYTSLLLQERVEWNAEKSLNSE
jgi:hypothetical protein